MKTTSPAHQKPTETGGFAGWRARNEWFAVDFYFGVVAFVSVLLAALGVPHIRDHGQNGLYAVLGAGLAIAGLVFAGLSVFAALISEDYLAILRAADPRGLSGAWRPYVIVATVALAAAAVALVGSIVWPGLGTTGQAIALALPVGLAVWAIYGTGQLVVITKFHGEQRAELLAHRIRAKGLLAARKDQRDRSA